MRKIKCFISLCIILSCISCVRHIDYTPVMEGDCVDRAIIIYSDLKKDDYEVKMVLGYVKDNFKSEDPYAHAWIKYKDKETNEWKNIFNY